MSKLLTNYYKNNSEWYVKNQVLIPGIIVLSILISIFHYTTAEYMEGTYFFIHIFLRRIYFIPVLLAAFWGGRRVVFMILILVTILYLPHAIYQWPATLSAGFDNISEFVLLWVVGGIAGTLSDKLKHYSSEKSRLHTLESISSVLGLINSEIMLDYKACIGLTTALESNLPKANGTYLSATILRDRLEHLGSHLTSIQDLVLPEPYEKRKISIEKIITKSIETNFRQNNQTQIIHDFQDQLPHVYLDEKRMYFALTNIIKSLIHYDNTIHQLSITVKRKLGSILIYFDMQNDNGSTKKWDLFKLYANSEGSYAFTLALSIIRSHGGKFEIDNSMDINSLKLYLPIRFGGRFFE